MAVGIKLLLLCNNNSKQPLAICYNRAKTKNPTAIPSRQLLKHPIYINTSLSPKHTLSEYSHTVHAKIKKHTLTL